MKGEENEKSGGREEEGGEGRGISRFFEFCCYLEHVSNIRDYLTGVVLSTVDVNRFTSSFWQCSGM